MEFQCCICTEDMLKINSVNVVTDCGHIYHTQCLLSWISGHKNCPECRADCNSQKFRKVYLKANEKPSELVNSLLANIQQKEKQIQKLSTYLCDNVREIEKLECIKSSLQEGLILRDAKITRLKNELMNPLAAKKQTTPKKDIKPPKDINKTSKRVPSVKPSSNRNDVSPVKQTIKIDNTDKKLKCMPVVIPKKSTGAIPKKVLQGTSAPRVTLIARTRKIGEDAKLFLNKAASVSSSITNSSPNSSSNSSTNSLNKVFVKSTSIEKRFIH